MTFADILIVLNPKTPRFLGIFSGVVDADAFSSCDFGGGESVVIFEPDAVAEQVFAIEGSIYVEGNAEFAGAGG